MIPAAAATEVHVDAKRILEALVVDSELARQFREFLEAKKRKREPLRWRGRGGGQADYLPRHALGFANFRAALRGVGSWGMASERLDALEHALRARHAVGLPLPRKVSQNEDCSLTVFWRHLTVRCMVDGVGALIGGVKGAPVKGVTNDVLDLLAFQARIQGGA